MALSGKKPAHEWIEVGFDDKRLENWHRVVLEQATPKAKVGTYGVAKISG